MCYVCSIGPKSFFLTEVLSPLCAISNFNCEQVKQLNFSAVAWSSCSGDGTFTRQAGVCRCVGIRASADSLNCFE